MMKLAVNYTPQAAELLTSDRIDTTYFKCPDWDDVIAEAQQYRPVYVHFPLHAGNGKLKDVDWNRVEAFMARTETQFVNIHIAPHVDQFPGLSINAEGQEAEERVVSHILNELKPITARFGKDNIILENVPYDPTPRFSILRPALMPAVFSQIVYESGCGLLLDTAHARIAALHTDQNPIDYLNALPGDQLRELHVTGTLYDQDEERWRDHFAMMDEDWLLVELTFENIQQGKWAAPQIVALEYGGVGPLFDWRSKHEVLLADMPRLTEFVETGLKQTQT